MFWYIYVSFSDLNLLAVAAVLSNWQNVLRAINLASSKIPKPRDENAPQDEPELPQTLVRIPMQHIEPAPASAAPTSDVGVK